uniref:Uncharacterized protein n=1 Tax=Anguilla anguilla TaxID=7936 RepID=A0A0E9RU82_ANGAN
MTQGKTCWLMFFSCAFKCTFSSPC